MLVFQILVVNPQKIIIKIKKTKNKKILGFFFIV